MKLTYSETDHCLTCGSKLHVYDGGETDCPVCNYDYWLAASDLLSDYQEHELETLYGCY